MGATWNKDLMSKVGKGLGMEAKLKNAGVLLGPTINIHRHPYGNDTCALPRFTTFVHSFADRTTGGRTFESFSEDAILSGELAVALVKGARLNPFSSSATDYLRDACSSDSVESTYDVSVDVRNVSRIDAKETAQVYVDGVLKAFSKVRVPVGNIVQVSLELDKDAFSEWNSDLKS
ncbi:hypothetical protein jhhlp_005373 [Lomentospora prolificans]|uniref:beta-glucosidase n=1 Tax=Lomentospora prolificans TaxID=41688 RepID=A0A2N3N6P1_9PEZI|nr:hypothetical protein jhhlp_005373 [Lomentospora prolificans]